MADNIPTIHFQFAAHNLCNLSFTEDSPSDPLSTLNAASSSTVISTSPFPNSTQQESSVTIL